MRIPILLSGSVLTVQLELTEEERATILVLPEFLEFVEHSSKILQRALNDNYDYIRDYTVDTESGGWVCSFGLINISSPCFLVTTQRAVGSNAYASSGTSDTSRIDP